MQKNANSSSKGSFYFETRNIKKTHKLQGNTSLRGLCMGNCRFYKFHCRKAFSGRESRAVWTVSLLGSKDRALQSEICSERNVKNITCEYSHLEIWVVDPLQSKSSGLIIFWHFSRFDPSKQITNSIAIRQQRNAGPFVIHSARFHLKNAIDAFHVSL